MRKLKAFLLIAALLGPGVARAQVSRDPQRDPFYQYQQQEIQRRQQLEIQRQRRQYDELLNEQRQQTDLMRQQTEILRQQQWDQQFRK
jgi:hypothetical protein